jgi:hypothetical protein
MGEPIIQEGFDHEAFTQGYQVISEREAYERYDDMLDECLWRGTNFGSRLMLHSGAVVIGVDAITAYRCGFNDYTSQPRRRQDLCRGNHRTTKRILVGWEGWTEMSSHKSDRRGGWSGVLHPEAQTHPYGHLQPKNRKTTIHDP